MNCAEILERLKEFSNPAAVAGMARYGINPDRTYGVSIPILRRLARQIGTDHSLASQLWASGIHEARILAAMTDDPAAVSESQMDRWAGDLDSWDVCDQCCMNLFEKTPFAYRKAAEWTEREEEFVKRAGFVLMARLAVSDKGAADKEFQRFFPIIIREAEDRRNYVKKAINWALRQIGKRNVTLNARAIAIADKIRGIDSSAARWIAADALRELTSDEVQSRLRRKARS